MFKTRIEVLTNELISAGTYIDRIFHVILQLQVVQKSDSVLKEITRDHFQEIFSFLNRELFQNNNLIFAGEFSVEIARKKMVHITKFIKSLLQLELAPDQHIYAAIKTINLFYEMAFHIHSYIDPDNRLKIQLPRTSITEIIKPQFMPEELKSPIPKFYLPLQNIEKLKDTPSNFIALDAKKEEIYDKVISDGHKFIFHKEYQKALDKFLQAIKIKETAHGLTLVAWVYSLINDFDQAKKYCIRAIDKDPDLGDPYNDMGSLLLSEGRLQDSFQWFDLAKKSKRYLNREFPYINSGRAYLIRKQYKEALTEFKTALKYVPYQNGLRQTINKLKNMISEEDRPTNRQ